MSRARSVIAAVLLLGSAVGALADDFAERMAREHPTPCFDQMAPFAARDIVQRDLAGLIDGLGEGRKLGPEWKRGNPDYDAAYATLSGAVSRHVAAHGPIATIDMRAFFQRGFARLADQQRKPFAEFLASDGGQIAWSHIVDDANCAGLLDSIERHGDVAFTDDDRKVLGTIKARLAARRAELDRRVSVLAPDVQDRISRNAQMFTAQLLKRDPGGPPPNRFGIDGRVVLDKLGRDLAGAAPRLIEIADRFAKAHAR